MSTILATGLSKSGDSAAETARDAVRQAKVKLGTDRVDLSIVYSSSKYDHGEVVAAVREATGNAPLIGASSAGEFTEERVESGSVAVGLLASDEIKVFTAIAKGVKKDPEAAIKEIAAKLPASVDGHPYLTAIILIDGLSGVGEEITLLASYLLDNGLSIVGGMAADNFRMEETHVFVDYGVCSDALGVCLFASKMPLFTGIKHGHTPLSEPLKVTRSRGNVLYEINGSPAWDVWKRETRDAARKRGIDVETLIDPDEIAQFFTNYILGLATEDPDQYKIRWPVGINDDGSLNFTCGIAEGSVFRIMDGSSLTDHINAARDAAQMARKSAESAGHSEFAGIIVFDCAVRKLMLGERFSEAVDGFKSVLPQVPLIGWETYGEIRLEPGKFSGFHNTTAVVLLLPGRE